MSHANILDKRAKHLRENADALIQEARNEPADYREAITKQAGEMRENASRIELQARDLEANEGL